MSAAVRWFAGFLEQGSAQSSTRVGALALVAGSIAFAFKHPTEPVTLGVMLSSAALFAGLRKSTTPESSQVGIPATGGAA